MAGRVVKAVFGVAGILLVSRLLGFLREIIIADLFGTTAQYDLYLVAIMLPALAYGVLNFSGMYLFVPYLSRKATRTPDGEISIKWSDIRPAINLAKTSALILTILIIILAPYVMKIWGADYQPDEFAQIVFYCRLIAVMVLLGVTEAFMRAYLNVHRRFTYPAAGYILYNVACIITIVLLNQRLSVGAIAIGVLAGLAVQNLYLLARIMGYHPFRGMNLKLSDSDTRAILATGGIIILIELINRSYFLIDRYIAPQFGDGVISALNYSQVVTQLPDSIIGLAIGAVVFPLFSDASSNLHDKRFGDVYQKAVTGAVLLAVPIAAYFLVNATDLVHILFHRGQFDQDSVALTANVLRPFAPSIIALFVISTSIRACYSGGWARPVLVFASITFIVKYGGTVLLPSAFGYPAITGATSLAHVAFAVMMLVFLTRKLPATSKARFLYNIIMLILIGVVTVLAVTYSNRIMAEFLPGDGATVVVTRLIVSGLFLVVVYLMGVYFLGLKHLFNVLKKKTLPDVEESSVA